MGAGAQLCPRPLWCSLPSLPGLQPFRQAGTKAPSSSQQAGLRRQGVAGAQGHVRTGWLPLRGVLNFIFKQSFKLVSRSGSRQPCGKQQRDSRGPGRTPGAVARPPGSTWCRGAGIMGSLTRSQRGLRAHFLSHRPPQHRDAHHTPASTEFPSVEIPANATAVKHLSF